MKKIKQVFPSRNYITIDSFGDVEVIFNPVGEGFEGDDKLMFRKGRWAFRVNDFLSGRVMPDGSKEGMGRKVYSLNLVYDDADGEPVVNTTYVDPTSVIPLDGSVVDVVGSEKLAQEETLQTVAKEETLQTVAKEETLQTVAKEGTLQTVAKEGTLQTVAKEETLKHLLDLGYVRFSHGAKYFVSFSGDMPYFLPKGCLIAFFDDKSIEREFLICKTDSILQAFTFESIDYLFFVGEFVKYTRSSDTDFEILNGFKTTSRKFRLYEPLNSGRKFK